MLTKDRKIEIKRLKEEGMNISQTSERMKLDWKTVKKVLSQNDAEKPKKIREPDDPEAEEELVKSIFSKLKAGVSPEEIVAEVGYVDLVTRLHEKWQGLRGYSSLNPQPPDPGMVRSIEKWEESIERYPDWHLKKITKALGQGAYLRMVNCRNYQNKGVECSQMDKIDPYECVGCLSCTLGYH
jgi:hypothetical protein